MSRWHKFDGIPDLPEQAFKPRCGKFGSMTLEGGGGSAPDPQIGEANKEQVALSREMFEDYKANDRPWLQDTANKAISSYLQTQDQARGIADFQLGVMKQNEDRYRNVGVRFEDGLISDVQRFDSGAYKKQQVDYALADTQSQFSNAQAQGLRAYSRMGINPNSGRAQAQGLQMSIEQAKAMASAANKTRMAADQIGLSTKMQMYGGMKGLSGLGAVNAQAASGALGITNQGASGMMGAATGVTGQTTGAFGASMQGANSALSNWGQQDAARMQASAAESAGWGQAAGMAAMALAYASDRRVKQNIERVGVDDRTGLNLYEFEYINGNGQRFRGVMADEVERVAPEAVFTMPDGYKAVNYAAIGLEMTPVQGVSA